MGSDIHGFLECADDLGDEPWSAAVDLELLYRGRNYDAFGCLFGIRNHARFRPLAADRGLPPDASPAVCAAFADWGRDAHGATWVDWAELRRVDWSEPAAGVDSRIHEYRRVGDVWVMTGKAGWSRRVADAIAAATGGEPGGAFPYREHDWPEGTEWSDGEDRLYRVGRLTRREAVPEGGEWAPVWAVMEALASVHGEGNVRLVVWFDG
ncbi:hypothetical protein [Streptomyces sp. NPDC058157]|uniref:hypothetical protein n=1 Tax=Streptomyces sp. NPDC058157 TaxID=3346360 RepID=UPI0036E646C5